MSMSRVHFQEEESPSLGDSTASIPWKIRRDFHGLTGQIKIFEKVAGLGFSGSSIIMFSPRPASELVGFEPEQLSLHDLFMLAIGCLPLPSRQYIALVDLWSSHELQFDGNPVDGGYGQDRYPDMGRMPSGFSEIIYRSDPDTPSQPPSLIRKDTMSRSRIRLLEAEEPVVLRLDKVNHWDDEIERMKGPFKQTMEELYALEPQTPDPALLAGLRTQMSMTFVDPSSDYIRLPKANDDTSGKPSNIFIWRADAQKLAHGLLTLPLHPQGYLIGGSSSTCCIRLLEFSAREFLYVLTRTRENIDLLAVSPDNKVLLKTSLEEVDKSVRKEQSGTAISSFQCFCALDEILRKSSYADRTVNEMIGIMVVANEEFTSFVRQSARHFDKSIAGSIDILLGTGFINVKLPFGGLQGFPVDLMDIYADWRPRDETINVN